MSRASDSGRSCQGSVLARKIGKADAELAHEASEPRPLKTSAELPLPLELPPAMFTGPGLLTLADLLPVMTAFVDRGLVMRFMNKALAEWLGRPRREMIGLHLREVIGEEAFAAREPMLADALTGERQFFVAAFNHPGRGLVAAQTEYVPWVDPQRGEVDGIAIVITDVSEQRSTEMALRESEQRFRRIANSAPEMMWVTRLDRV